MPTGLILTVSLLVLAAALAIFMDRLAGLRRPDGDRGDYWSRVATYSLFPLAFLLALSQVLPSLGWPVAWTLRMDLAGGNLQYWLALSLPFLGWGGVLLASLTAKPSTGESMPWLVGGAGFFNSRHWLLWCALPLALIVAVKAVDLGGGESAYPAAVWSVLVVTLLTLSGLAFSKGREMPDMGLVAENVSSESAANPKPWPDCMADSSIQAKPLPNWPFAKEPKRTVRGPEAQAFAQRLDGIGANNVAPPLIEGVTTLLRQNRLDDDDYGAIQVVFAPDDCGQVEVLSLTATLLHQQFHTVTLIVVPSGSANMADRLRGWLPDTGQAVVALDYGEIPDSALIWVADAEFLSDRLLAQMKNPRFARRIGLVAWWRLDDYSGVMAANLWAITRRLHRMLRFQGRPDIRTLALLRSASPDTQLGDFVRRLLPHSNPAETHVGSGWARSTSLYLLEAKNASPAQGQYLLFRAAAASVTGGWSTCLQATEFMATKELNQFRQLPVNGNTMGERLRPDPASADVRLLHLNPADVLALQPTLAQSGRALPSLSGHIGLVPPSNPYVAYLLGRLAKDHDLPGSKRLVCAESCPAIIKRHLLLALNEMPATRRGLLESALSDERVVVETLRDLADAGQLTRREVRFLGENGRLIPEFEYQSLRIPAGQFYPLDTVGSQLLEVREGGTVCLRLDPERLLIAAYPGRVFLRDGQRYRIRDWHSVEEAKRRGWVDCQREDQCYVNWRIHSATVFGIRPLRGEEEVTIGRQGILTRLAVELHYQEEVTGWLEWTEDPCRLPIETPKPNYFVSPLTDKFKTRAVVLRLTRRFDDTSSLTSLCQALRHVLPVHLGVEEDALEVACLNGADINGEESYGLAIVDLYPGGIGLTDAIRDDSALLLRLLEWSRDWLCACPDDALQTPMALATNPDQAPQRKAALKLLDQIL